MDYICNQNCANNKYGWCKVNKCCVSVFKKKNLSNCDWFVETINTPESFISTLIDSFDKPVLMENKYNQGYVKGLKEALEIIKKKDLAYKIFKK